jgi:aminoglycoside phosphotransferase (APT) family kinase protein
MFKSNWEKTSITHPLPPGMVEKMVLLAYPHKKLIFHELIAGGCANLNIKILLENEPSPLLLRIYLRDKTAAYKEQKLSKLLKKSIPIPLTHYIGEIEDYQFAITEFMLGISLRDLLLGNIPPHDLSAIMYDVGTTLSKITIHEFPKAGFFDRDLNIVSHEETIFDFAQKCLQSENIKLLLKSETISQIHDYFNKFKSQLVDTNERHLVHGDFDPANILVNRVDNVWKVSGVLDFEFSFSGSIVWDISNMLRYGHKMPPEFQESFLTGLTSGGIKLPENWHTTANLFNLLSLLDCLKRSNFQKSPNLCFDILDLIEHILSTNPSQQGKI